MKTYWITMMLMWCMSSLGANYVYQGNGTNPNDWFDDDNWSDAAGITNWPSAGDNAMFQSTQGMTVSQTVPTHNQLQVGRGAMNTVTLATGCVMTNLNQTIVGILDNGEGHLLVDGGTLITKALRLSVGNTALSPGSRFELQSGTVHVDSSIGGANAGDIDLGLNESAAMEISGGVLTVDNNLDFTAGLLKVAGASGSIEIGNKLNLGTDTNSSTQLSFELDESGSVSTVFADDFSLEGVTVLEVDASLASDGTVLDLVLIDLGSDTFSAAEFSTLSNAMVAADISNAELSLSADDSQLLFSGRVEGTRILSTSVDGDWLKLELQTSGSPEDLFLVGRTNLNADWRSIAYATNNAGDGLMANLAQAPLEGNHRVVYVPANGEQAFFGVESAPLDEWFAVVAENDPTLTTDVISSGGCELGISSIGGGYINRLTLPGLGDVMGNASDKFGRGGQSAIRDILHGERYNPTQAGFSDPAGTICRVLETMDDSALVVPPRPCVLFRGDGKFDFTEWENLADDGYVESGGSNDWDTIDESLLPGKQATEVTSEFDYFCTYEDLMDADPITIPCFRHYYEYRYVRDPGHCIEQHNLGPLFDPVTGEVTDISVAEPAGVYPATPDDMGILKFAMSIRMDRSQWAPTYHWHANGSTINDLSVQERGETATARRFFRDTSLAARTPGFTVPGYAQVHAPLIILSDSTDLDQGGALGLYYPDSDININSIVGVDKESGAMVYRDDRRLHMEVRDSPVRVPAMQWIGFRGHLLGMLNPTRTPQGTIEVLRGEFYLLYGSPREIFEHAQLIQPF
jgi:hypothetical protein